MEENEEKIQAIGAKLRSLRKAAGYGGHDTFAWEHGLSRIQYWRIEKGTNFTIKYLLKVLAIHNMSLEEFFKDL